MHNYLRGVVRRAINAAARRIGALSLMEFLAQSISSEFVTYHIRPVLASDTRSVDAYAGDLPRLAIVIQGPISVRNNFTIETVRLYRRRYRSAIVIVSTWNDESPSIINDLRDIGAHVVVSRKPEYAGPGNINFQIVSTQAGIATAASLGAERVLKTRTDQRLCGEHVDRMFHAMTNAFPLHVRSDQRQRIIGCTFNTFSHRLYGISDMLLYGDISDMTVFWSAALDSRVMAPDDHHGIRRSLRTFSESRVCEVYLVTEYMRRIGRELKWTLEDSWLVMADHFCVVPKEDVDLLWPKYSMQEHRWRQYDGNIAARELSFGDWLTLYTKSFDPKMVRDDLLNAPVDYSRPSRPRAK